MPIDVGDIVLVTFSHYESPRRQLRPALVVRAIDEPAFGRLLWTFMITEADNAPWLDDIAIPMVAATGLRAPSIIRPAKMMGIAASRIVKIGRADSVTLATALDFLIAGPRR